MNTTWQCLCTGANTGAFNMEMDGFLAKSLLNGTGMPTLRLYSWKPWAISLGFNQDASKIDAARCAADGIDIVRRPTGGRAVFHAEELTYSVVMFADGKSVLEIYNYISKALVQGLRLYGVNATLSRSQPDLRAHYKSPSSIPCFTASARYEIEWHGKKLVGSAQRRFRNPDTGREVVLQHGSILIGPAHRRLTDYLVADNGVKASLDRELEEKTIELASIGTGKSDVEELTLCIRQGFHDEWQIETAHSDHVLVPVHG